MPTTRALTPGGVDKRQRESRGHTRQGEDKFTNRQSKCLFLVTGCLQRGGVAHGWAGHHHTANRREMRVLCEEERKGKT